MRCLVALVVGCALAPRAHAQPSVPAAEPYKAAVAEVEKLIKHEVGDKKLPALSVALVDDQKVVWAAGYGFQDRGRKTPATAETVYRVGSVSKLFTDVAVMQLVEDGKLDIDAPVAKYVPKFKPSYRDGEKPITLRMLMSHRSGLIREPPTGNYFDPSEPSLEKTVLSMNGIGLVYPPSSRMKYSNAAIGVVGYTLQQSQKEQFEKYVQRRVIDPLGMNASSFLPTAGVKKGLADAVMWTYHGKEFPAPTFELGAAPAGCMYSTVLDLAKFQSCLFADGKVADKAFLKPESIKEMLSPQFSENDALRQFGLGFVLGELDGKKRVGHGGAIYGFATEFALLPGEKLGVVVVSSRDSSNAVVTRIANDLLRLAVAAKAGKPLPAIETSEPLKPEETRALVGRYRSGDRWLDLSESFGRLFVESGRGGSRIELRKAPGGLVADDVTAWGARYTLTDGKLAIGKFTFEKEKPRAAAPADAPGKFAGLIGEYGWDHLPLIIYEKDGQLHALIELTEIDPLTQESDDVFAFPPDRGMYYGEKLVFSRDKSGRATKVTCATVVMDRRKLDGENGETFKVKPTKPLAEVRKGALAATPPVEKGEFLKPDLVDLATIEGVKFDIRYATDNNFLSAPFYTSAKAFMQKPAAAALARVHTKLKEQGYGLLVFDAYRPWHVTKMFWDATPEKFHGFVADPSKGSRHNRGCAVDLALYDLKTGKPIEVVSGYDEFSDRAFPDYMGGTSKQRWHRDLLRRAMEAEGFTVYEEEWWHFDYKDWKKYPILNKTFEELTR
ncbi:serine hydrolase [Gemmata sp. JC673]|uniref:D-alanyl-D-alanine dipeptidase n=1 Tax=Gemmata algarum TaxID=2975278 RepID=A0ABU5EV46_9BACT|nr:serine hydrolase [Gemmata algarum]MDY3559040.1 serine hydrolase [Gemmata algarum]